MASGDGKPFMAYVHHDYRKSRAFAEKYRGMKSQLFRVWMRKVNKPFGAEWQVWLQEKQD